EPRTRARCAPVARAAGGRSVGTIRADIVRSANAAGESPLGDVIADAELAATRAPEAGGAVVAFMNGGGIRADLLARGAGQAAAPSEVTYPDLFALQPFGNGLPVIPLARGHIQH